MRTQIKLKLVGLFTTIMMLALPRRRGLSAPLLPLHALLRPR